MKKNALFNLFQSPVFFIGYVIVMIVSYFYWDQSVALFFDHLTLPASVDALVHILNDLGLGWFYVFGLPIAALIACKGFKNNRLAAMLLFIWGGLLVAGIACDIMKVILGRARPELFFAQQLYGFYGLHLHSEFWSFPSGHSTVITAIMAGISILKPRYTVWFMITALIICFMRIILTQHYISDVMAAFYLAIFSVSKFNEFYQKKRYTLPSILQF